MRAKCLYLNQLAPILTTLWGFMRTCHKVAFLFIKGVSCSVAGCLVLVRVRFPVVL